MKKRMLSTLFLTILLASFSSAVLINEFTVDPQTDWDGSGSATSSDEWIELYNPSNQTVDLTNWTLMLIDSSNATETLTGTILPNSYLIILDPEGTQNNDGQVLLYNPLGELIDSVTYGDWDDGNISDNAPDGNAEDYSDECIARIPNGQDTGVDSDDFIKTECTYGFENRIISPEEQSTRVKIADLIVFKVFPRILDFGTVQPRSFNNPAINGPIVFDVNGSSADVNVEITEVIGSPFDTGLKIDGSPALGSSWLIPFTSPIQTANATLDVGDLEPGENYGTIVYTVTGPTP